MNTDALWRDVEEGGSAKETTISALEHLPEAYIFSIDGKSLPVEVIEFDATLRIVIPRMPLVEAAEYSSSGADPASSETFAKIGRWKSPDNGLIKEMIFIGFLKRNKPDDAT